MAKELVQSFFPDNAQATTPELDAPRYKPGDKISGGIALPDSGPSTDIMSDLSFKGSLHNDPATKAVDIFWRGLRNKYGHEQFPGLIELPKPEKMLQLIDIAARAVRDVYPDVTPLRPEQVLWLDDKGFAEVSPTIGTEYFYGADRLMALGMGADTTAQQIAESENLLSKDDPARLLLRANLYSGINSQDEGTRLAYEHYALETLVESAINRAVAPTFIPHTKETARIFERQLDDDARRMPKGRKEANIEGFKQMVREYRDAVVNKDGSPTTGTLIEADGALLRLGRMTENGEYEPFLRVATGLNGQLIKYVADAALTKAFEYFIDCSYPEDRKRDVFTGFVKISRENLRSVGGNNAIAFLNQIGVKTPQEAATALFESKVPELYQAAKIKKKNLDYPIDKW